MFASTMTWLILLKSENQQFQYQTIAEEDVNIRMTRIVSVDCTIVYKTYSTKEVENDAFAKKSLAACDAFNLVTFKVDCSMPFPVGQLCTK